MCILRFAVTVKDVVNFRLSTFWRSHSISLDGPEWVNQATFWPDEYLLYSVHSSKKPKRENSNSTHSRQDVYPSFPVAYKEFKVLRKSRSVARQNSQIESQKPKPNKLICSVNTFWVSWYLLTPSQQTKPLAATTKSLPLALLWLWIQIRFWCSLLTCSRRMLRASNCIYRRLSCGKAHASYV